MSDTDRPPVTAAGEEAQSFTNSWYSGEASGRRRSRPLPLATGRRVIAFGGSMRASVSITGFPPLEMTGEFCEPVRCPRLGGDNFGQGDGQDCHEADRYPEG